MVSVDESSPIGDRLDSKRRSPDAVLPAIHDEGLAGDKAGSFRGEKQDGSGDISWFSEPLDSLALPRPALLLFRETRGRGRIRQSGQDGIRGNSVGRHIVGQAPHE